MARARGLTAARAQALVRAAGGDIQHALDEDVLARVELPPGTLRSLLKPDWSTLEADRSWIAASGVKLLPSTDARFPTSLAATAGAPGVLFVRGDPGMLARPQIAIVGSRSPTPAGRRIAERFAMELASHGLVITSGLAQGIDGASHEGALRAGGCTIAVCATGLDRLYPTQHRDLARRIEASGAVVSEVPRAAPVLRRDFARRNRIVSALSLGTLVIEAALGSGALITAALARRQGRKVLAVPGSIGNPLARGCHQLIRGGARLVESPSQALEELQFSLKDEALVSCQQAPPAPRPLDKGYEMLLDALGFEPASIDVLTARTGWPAERLASMLLILELEGRVAPHPGGRFGRVPVDDDRQRSRHSDLRV